MAGTLLPQRCQEGRQGPAQAAGPHPVLKATAEQRPGYGLDPVERANQEMWEAEEPLDPHVAAITHTGEERLWHQDLTGWTAVSGGRRGVALSLLNRLCGNYGQALDFPALCASQGAFFL